MTNFTNILTNIFLSASIFILSAPLYAESENIHNVDEQHTKEKTISKTHKENTDIPQKTKKPKRKRKKFTKPPIVIDNFDIGNTEGLFSERVTSIGAFQGTWAKRPAWSLITKTEEPRRGSFGKAQRMEWKTAGGWCGWYTLLDGLDASGYNAITFWVKGRDGNERFDIGLADSKMQDLEIDAKYAGAVNFFIEGGSITKEWKKVRIPLARLGADINASSLGSLVFWFRYEIPGETALVYVDDIMIEIDDKVEKMEEYNAPRAEFDPKHPRSLWVWKIDPVTNLKARQDMFDLCLKTAIRKCYVYFGDFDQDEDPRYTKLLEEFLEESHAKDIHIEVLTGNPTWCLKENHHFAYDWMKSFLEYNKNRPPEQHINGCSFDVEPYLAGEWNTRRDEVKKEYIDLLIKLRNLIDGYEDQHFELGGAIPFFYEGEGDFEETMLQYFDYAALMVYYDSPNKVIELSKYHIDLATKTHKQMFIGVETQDLITMNQGPRKNTFYEEGWEEMEQAIVKIEEAFQGQYGYGGIAMHCYYSYKLLQRGRNTPTKLRPKPEDLSKFVANYQEGSVEIDGKLDDWITTTPIILNKKDQVQYGRGAWTDRDDYSLKAYAMWDLYNVYFAFEIKDDKLVQTKTGQEIWEGDHVEFWLDLDLLGDYNEAMNSKDDYQFGFSPGNFDNLKPEIVIFTPEIEPEQYLPYVEIASTKTAEGYIVEVRIEAKLFNDIKIKDSDPSKQIMSADRSVLSGEQSEEQDSNFSFREGMMIGTSIDSSDCDDPSAPQKLLMSTSSPRVWGDPTTFSRFELKK